MLDDIRKKIDEIDNSMKPLFLERLACSRQVAETKAKTKEEGYVPKREEEIIADRSEDTQGETQEAYTAFLKDQQKISIWSSTRTAGRSFENNAEKCRIYRKRAT